MRLKHHFSVAHVLAGTAALALLACHGDSNVKSPPASPVLARPVSLLFVDAATNQPITASLQAVARDANGQLSTVTRDRSGGAASTFSATGGALTFQVDPSTTQALSFIVVATVDGYNSTSVHCDLPANAGYQETARMVRIGAPPVGVATVQAPVGTTDATGATAATIAISTPPEPNSLGTSTLSVPQQTKITAVDGTPLTGELVATLSYFNNQDSSSLAAFPGGLDVTVPSTPTSASAASGSFVSGGFTAIELKDGSGNQAKNFSQPVAVKIDIAPGTVNPDTGAALKAGDVIPFWSYDETTGQWKSEGTVTVQSNGSGGLQAVGNVIHLSYWNLDWFRNQDLCQSHAATIAISGNSQKLPLRLEVRASGYYHETTATDSTIVLANPVVGVWATITASYNGNVVGSAGPIQNLCGATVNLNVNVPVVTPASLTVHVKRVCNEDHSKTTPVPSVGVYLYSSNGVQPGQFTDASGNTTFSGLSAGEALTAASENHDAKVTLGSGSNSVDVSIPWTCALTGAAGGSP